MTRPRGKWTVIDPNGEERTFETAAELIAFEASMEKKNAEDAKVEPHAPPLVAQATSAAASILDDLPSQPLSVVPGRLEIVESETDVSKHDSEGKVASPPIAASSREVIDGSLVDSVPSDVAAADLAKDDEQPLSLRDVTVVPVPKLPEGSIAPKASVQVSMPPPLPDRARSIAPKPKLSKAPPDDDDVEKAKAGPSTAKSATHVESTKRDEPKKDDSQPTAKKKTEPKKPQKPAELREEDLMKPASSRGVPAAPADAQGEGKNGWVTPVLAVAAVVVAIWFVTKGSGSSTTTTDPPTKTGTSAEAPSSTTSATTVASATPSASASASASAVASALGSASAKPSASAAPTDKTASAKPHGKPGDTLAPATSKPEREAAPAKEPTTMAELLDHAGKARRAGDPARARELYDRVLASAPSNVEALYGLGNVARAEGNLAGAKQFYQKAVSVNGSFFPALLGLADAEWDSGDKASAKAHYTQLYKSSPTSAPPRAKERAEIAD